MMPLFKNWLALFASAVIFTLLSFNSHAQTLLVSDIDDTLKQSHIRDLKSMRFLASREFAGLSQLYGQLKAESIDEIGYVTSAPNLWISRPRHLCASAQAKSKPFCHFLYSPDLQ